MWVAPAVSATPGHLVSLEAQHPEWQVHSRHSINICRVTGCFRPPSGGSDGKEFACSVDCQV